MLIRPRTFRRLCQARDLLVDLDPGCDDAPAVGDIARAIAMSPFQFIRQFHAVFGVTPHQLRIQARLERARALLAAGDRSVTEVCLEVGFSSLGSFSSLFTRRTGTSPSVYRRAVRASVQVPAPLRGSAIPGGCLGLLAYLPATFRNFREAPVAPLRQGDAS